MANLREILNVFLRLTTVIYYREKPTELEVKADAFFSDFYSSKIVSSISDIPDDVDLINVLPNDVSLIEGFDCHIWIEKDLEEPLISDKTISGKMKEFYIGYFLSDCSG